MVFSRRSETFDSHNPLSVAMQRMRHQGGGLLDLTVSNPTAVRLDEPPETASALLAPLGDAGGAQYRPTPLGPPAALSACARHWSERGPRVEPAELFLTSSTSEAYAHLFKLLCDAGDEVLVPEPSYPLFEELARYEQIRLVPYALYYDGAWALDDATLLAARSERTRAVIVVSPNNPTGHFTTAAEFDQLLRMGLPLISDEVFVDYPIEPGRPYTGLLSVHDPARHGLAFCLDGLSKSAGLPQHKAAWTVVRGPAELVREAFKRLEYIADAFLSVSGPVQGALPELLARSGPRRAAIAARIRSNYQWLRGVTDNTPTSALHVEGGWSVVLRLPSVLDEDTWCLDLLEEGRVLVQPGWWYDIPLTPVVVVSLLTAPELFRAGIHALLRRVAQHAG